MERQLLWNDRMKPKEEIVRYFFVIINESREAEAIKSRLFESLAPVDEVTERSGKAGQSQYFIIALNSQKKLENISSIYRGRIRKDTRLYERNREGIDGLENYVVSQLK